MVDLGCGRGDSVDVFRAADPAVRWLGLDLEGRVEFAQRTREDADLRAFDGRPSPCAAPASTSCSASRCSSTSEGPDPLPADVARVLRPGGAFAGSTSHLEPFHSRSVANYTRTG